MEQIPLGPEMFFGLLWNFKQLRRTPAILYSLSGYK